MGLMDTARAVLSSPSIYSLWDRLANGHASKVKLVDEYIQPGFGERILDIGCGPGDIVPYLRDVTYVGIDASQAYIDTARKRFGDRATFNCEPVGSTLEEYRAFDIVTAIGVVHHLDDRDALALFELAFASLKPGGRLITYDGCFVEDQSFLARWFISQDRGQYVRNVEAYVKIAKQVFTDIRVGIRHDMMRIPYTRLILECRK